MLSEIKPSMLEKRWRRVNKFGQIEALRVLRNKILGQE